MLTVLLNVASRFYTGGISLLLAPILIRVLGYSNYGLVGVLTLVQAIAFLADLGLSACVTREIARSPNDAPSILRSFEVVYWGLSLVCGLLLWAASPLLAVYWLNDGSGPVVWALRLMSVVLVTSMPVSLYSSALVGLQRSGRMSVMQAIITTIRNVGAVLAIVFVSPTPEVFFGWHAGAAILGALISRQSVWMVLPGRARIEVGLLRKSIGFAAGMGSITVFSTIIHSVDRVVLAKVLPLAGFGIYSLATALSGALLMAAVAVYNNFISKVTDAIHAGDRAETQRLFQSATDLTLLLAAPVAATVIAFASRVMVVASGRDAGWLTLVVLTVATLLNALSWPPYLLIVGSGRSKALFWVYCCSCLLFAPGIGVAAVYFGALGAASGLTVYQVANLVAMVWIAVWLDLLKEPSVWGVYNITACLSAFCPAAALSVMMAGVGFHAPFSSLIALVGAGGFVAGFYLFVFVKPMRLITRGRPVS